MDSPQVMSLSPNLVDIDADDLAYLREFQPFDWPDITIAFSFYINTWYCKPMKLVLDLEIIGIGNIIFMHSSAWLSQIIVKETHRNQGWGSFITKRLIDYCSDKVKSISLLSTDMGFPVYEKLGFKPQDLYYFYNGTPVTRGNSDFDISDYDASYHCDILDLDKEVSGEIRARLLNDHLKAAKVINKNGRLIAYYFPSLGEGMIISKEPDAGLEILNLHLTDKNKIAFPEKNIIAHDYLLQHGFTPYRRAHRMVLGTPLAYKPEWIYGRIGGNLG